MPILYPFGIYTIDSLGTPQQYGPEALSQTFKQGAPLVRNAAGYLQEASPDPVGVTGFSADPGKNGTANGSKTSFYDPLIDEAEYVGCMDTSASEGTGTILQTYVGERFGITKSAQAGTNLNRWYIDITKTDIADQRVEVTGLIDDAGTIQGRVRFIPIAL